MQFGNECSEVGLLGEERVVIGVRRALSGGIRTMMMASVLVAACLVRRVLIPVAMRRLRMQGRMTHGILMRVGGFGMEAGPHDREERKQDHDVTHGRSVSASLGS